MLGDKDISASLQSLTDDIDFWYTGVLDVPRAEQAKQWKKT